MYLSLMFSQDEMQLEMYRWMNSVGSGTTVVNRFTTCENGMDASCVSASPRPPAV